MLTACKFLTLLLTALSLTMTSAHLLELSPKLKLDPQLYAAINGTLYANFASIGAIYMVGSIVFAIALAIMLRNRTMVRGWTFAGALALLLGLVSWIILVAPVNRAIATALQHAPSAVPHLWQLMRPRWEYGHVVGFVCTLIGFCALLLAVLLDTRDPSAILRGGRLTARGTA